VTVEPAPTAVPDRTRGLITAKELGLMNPTAYLINTSRGPIVDEGALLEVLGEGRIAGAALDVYDLEPIPPDHPLLALDNVLLTPHLGYVTRENLELFYEGTVEAIAAFAAGNPIRTLNPEPA
jgi:phosphoglycerate dehydrogenase-like enzyme